jgi:hydroxypyruvate reductase
MNTVRKHLSRIKGGRLAAATKARVHTLVVSDVPGDQGFQVASGPTLPDGSTRDDALEVVELYRLALPEAAMAHLRSDAADAPRPGDPRFARNTFAVIASAGISLTAAAEVARAAGIAAHILADDIEGEASVVGKVHAALARRIATRDAPFSKPVVLLSGGETTVTVRGNGRGGRNAEFLLAFADAIAGVEGIEALAADTDGIDGSEDNAGAFADGTSVARLRALGHDPRQLLGNNDSHSAFAALGDLLVTGPTGTNVNDFRAIRIG